MSADVIWKFMPKVPTKNTHVSSSTRSGRDLTYRTPSRTAPLRSGAAGAGRRRRTSSALSDVSTAR